MARKNWLTFCQRFDSKAQMERFQRAAKRRRLSLNSFLVIAGEKLAEEILGPKEDRRKQPSEASLQPSD